MAATKRIVLIDFDRKSLEATRQRLVEMGYEVTAVAEAAQVNLALSGSPPDLVILEPMIPGKDGFALCRTLKQGKGGRIPKVILASRIYRTPRLKSLAHEAGADAWLERPRHDELLYQAVARLAPLPAEAPPSPTPAAPAVGRDPGEEPTATSLADLMIDDDELENVFSTLLQEEPGAGTGAAVPEPAAAPVAAPAGHEADPLPNLWPDELGERLSASGPIPTGPPAGGAAPPAGEEERTATVAVADPAVGDEVDEVLSQAFDLAAPASQPAPAAASPAPPAPDVTAPPEPTIELETGDEPTGGPPPAPTGEQEIPEALRGMDRGTAELLSSLEELEDSIPVEEDGSGSWPETGSLAAELESSVPLPPPPPPEEEQTLEEVLSKIQETSGVVPLAEATSPEELSGPDFAGAGSPGRSETAEGPRPLPPLPPQFLPPRHERRSSWVGWFLGALAVGVILAGIVGAVWLRNRPEPPVQKVFPRPAAPAPAPATAGGEEKKDAAATPEPLRRLPARANTPSPRTAPGTRGPRPASPANAEAKPRTKPSGQRPSSPAASPAEKPPAPRARTRGPASARESGPAAPPAGAARNPDTGRKPGQQAGTPPGPPATAEHAGSGSAGASPAESPEEGARKPAAMPPPDAAAAPAGIRAPTPTPAPASVPPEGRPKPQETSRRAPGATRTTPHRGPLEARAAARPRVHLPPPPEPPPAPSALAKPAPVVRLSELDHPLRRVAGQLPALTPEAREAGIHGRVFLNLLVGPDGTVREARVMIEPGYGLGEAAARAVRSWRYSPPRRDGEPVRVWKTEVVEFTDAGNEAAAGTPAP